MERFLRTWSLESGPEITMEDDGGEQRESGKNNRGDPGLPAEDDRKSTHHFDRDNDRKNYAGHAER